MRRCWAAVLLTTALVGVGCGGNRSDTMRPPLADPPDPGPPPASHGLSASEVARIAPSTVRVFGISCGRAAEGSGFAIAHDIIVTNAHVLVGVDDPTIEVGSGLRTEADIVAFDAHNDLALLRVEGLRFEPLPLGTAGDGTTGGVFGWEQGPELEVTPFRVDRPVTVRIEAVGTDERVGRPSYLLGPTSSRATVAPRSSMGLAQLSASFTCRRRAMPASGTHCEPLRSKTCSRTGSTSQ